MNADLGRSGQKFRILSSQRKVRIDVAKIATAFPASHADECSDYGAVTTEVAVCELRRKKKRRRDSRGAAAIQIALNLVDD